MTRAGPPGGTRTFIADELRAWLGQNWDPQLTVREWWARLAKAGWSQPHWPEEWFGRGLTEAESQIAVRVIREFGAITAPVGFATGLAGPTLLVHGTENQKARFLPGMVLGTDAYCQLFSEPNAGSDLASLQCRAIRDGDQWIVNGQKVWTSAGQIATKAILIARTNVDVPKHAGISYFIIDMCQPGVEVRPLREMTGRSYFNEVFLKDATVPAADLVGGEGNGWAVTNTTLAFERALSGGFEVASTALAGPIVGNLDRAAGAFVRGDADGPPGGNRAAWETLAAVASRLGRDTDPVVRDGLTRLYSLERLNSLNSTRARALRQTGYELPGLANMAKMAQNHILRLARDMTYAILGVAGTLHAYDPEASALVDGVTSLPGIQALTDAALFAQGPSIYGGTDQIQRNVLAERTLGLPRDASGDKDVPFRDLLKNPSGPDTVGR